MAGEVMAIEADFELGITIDTLTSSVINEISPSFALGFRVNAITQNNTIETGFVFGLDVESSSTYQIETAVAFSLCFDIDVASVSTAINTQVNFVFGCDIALDNLPRVLVGCDFALGLEVDCFTEKQNITIDCDFLPSFNLLIETDIACTLPGHSSTRWT